ncbi:MAG: hypothetical protein JSU85_04795, partial [Candidatus Zixiibacteriota bacterium]
VSDNVSILKNLSSGSTGRCCYNDNQNCVDTTGVACLDLGGYWDAGLNCIDDPCLVEGRCCYNNNQNCVDTTEAACLDLAGNWDAGLNCTDDPCPCDYVVGNVNGSDNYNGLDVTYGVAYLKGGNPPLCEPCSLCPDWHYCGDVNGSCNYNGLDITYGVAYLKGGARLITCEDCPRRDGATITIKSRDNYFENVGRQEEKAGKAKSEDKKSHIVKDLWENK